MSQLTFTDIEYSKRRRPCKLEVFLNQMDAYVPWAALIALIEPFYPKGRRGHPPVGIETMLRMYLLQCWNNLSDVATEENILLNYAFRRFMKINFLEDQVPDATTLLKFRHLLEKHDLAEKIFNAVTQLLEERGVMMRGGTIVDATIIAAPSSTKNEKKERDPEMHSTKKGNQFHFGMKAHIGVDAGSGLVHSATFTPANAHDVTEASKLIRDDDEVVYGDSGYIGLDQREEVKNDAHLSKIEYRINLRPSSLRKGKKKQWGIDWDKEREKQKSSVRSKVEHTFHISKDVFGYRKTVYKGLAKNANRLYILFASANILMCVRAGRSLSA